MGADDKQYALEEVEEHNIGRGPDKTVWMVIHDKVYDVTKFLDEVSFYISNSCKFIVNVKKI